MLPWKTKSEEKKFQCIHMSDHFGSAIVDANSRFISIHSHKREREREEETAKEGLKC